MHTPSADRLLSLDALRGLIVILMALDHVRMYFSAAPFDPLDLDQTRMGYFFTRWITHLCAPGFFFLAGVSVWLQQRRGVPRLKFWLAARGLWLIVLELTVFGLAWSFSTSWRWFGVIWGLGASMLLLAVLLDLPRRGLLYLAAGFLLVHNSAAELLGHAFGPAAPLAYAPGVVDLPLLGPVLVIYPLLPWAAVMMLGYASAPQLLRHGEVSPSRLLRCGAALLALFVLARSVGFGEPMQGGIDATRLGAQALLSFLNVEKYPPSLQYVLVTLGALCLLWAGLEQSSRRSSLKGLRALPYFGREPFFFYLIHLFLIHAAALAVAWLCGWPMDYLFWQGVEPNLVPPAGYGVGLVGVYLAWLGLMLAALPLCVAYARFRRSRGGGGIWRLL